MVNTIHWLNSPMDIFIPLLHLLHQYNEVTKHSSKKISDNSVGEKPAPFPLLSHKQIFQVYWLLEGFLDWFKAHTLAVGLSWREEQSKMRCMYLPKAP